ncbi:MAG: phosphohistidine phosphatase SixA [Planctomycetota bacterium]|nr:phosphohistidine phosphatase SixA [Planctomycetota bacterium]
MRLYLVRHGEARSGEEDLLKCLSAKGQADVRKLAALLRPRGIAVEAIWQSGKARAAETAAALAEAVTARQGVAQWPGLEPNDPIGPVLSDVLRAEGDLMIVGHLPLVARLASKLVTGDESALRVDFGTATVVCIERDFEVGWRLLWMISPEVL